MPTIEEISRLARDYMQDADLTLLQKACDYATNIHRDAIHRSSGESYISHLLAVTHILVSMRLDLQTVIAGMLHGVIKEAGSEYGVELQKLFGKDVASIVNGATRITNVRYNSKLAYQAENIRKLLLAMASDIRVLLVKLADRLHDMRSLTLADQQLSYDLGQETMDLYAPLASRLGIDWMKRELEDLSFKALYPDDYQDLTSKIESSTADRQAYVEEVIGILQQKLADSGLKDCHIIGRPKHLYSIYKKTVVQNIPVEKVYDKVAFRILVRDVKECYEALGVIHANWPPVPGRIKDFISTPKANNYQAMHTTVVGPRGEFMEVQIRTWDMDKVAQEGVAAHWAYKEGQAISKEDARVFEGLKKLVQWLQELKDPREFLDSVKGGLYEKPDVYALTPNGEVKEFPEGSTPIDFAFAIHTEVGNKCTGAKVNGRIVPLKYELQNGDQVEIITSANQRPRRGWLSLVKTSRARSRVRQWLRREEHEKAANLGREICERELRKHDTTLKKIIKTGHIKKLLKDLKCNSLEDLLGKVGSGGITIQTVVKELQPADIRPEAEVREAKATAEAVHKPGSRDLDAGARDETITIDGVDDMLVKISQCCLPVPGDAIMGFITTGRGISIHKANCVNLLATDPHRWIEVSWSTSARTVHRAQIQVLAQDRKGILAEISNIISQEDANILEMKAYTRPDNLAANSIVLEVTDLSHLRKILQHLRQQEGVVEARRV